MSNEIKVPIPSRVYNAATGGHVAGAEDIDFGQKVKHLVKYDHSGNEVSFASQLSAQNTIYVIHDDFTLTANVTIPSGCTLKFEGGSISGAYTITGNKTNINSKSKCIDNSVSFAGTWHLQTVYVDWFVGATINVDCSTAIAKAISLAKLARTSITFGDKGDTDTKYYCTSGGFDVSNLTIYGNGSSIGFIGDCEGFTANGDLTIKDLTIYKFPYQHEDATGNTAIDVTGNWKYTFDNVYIDGFYRGWRLYRAWNVKIDKCVTYRCSTAIYIRGESLNNSVCNSRIDATEFCVDVNGTEINDQEQPVQKGEGLIMSNNIFTSANIGVKVLNMGFVIINNNIIDLLNNKGVEAALNCPGLSINNNYIGLRNNAGNAIEIYEQNILNDEDAMFSIRNNMIKYYGITAGGHAITCSSGIYRLIYICGNHIHATQLDKGIYSTSTVNTLYVRDNLIEYTVDEYGITIANATNVFNTDNVVIQGS